MSSKSTGLSDLALRVIEPTLSVASGLGSEPIAGLYGLATGEPDNVDKLHHKLTYQPVSEAGREGLGAVAGGLNWLGSEIMDNPYSGGAVRGYRDLSDRAGELSPVLGAAMDTLPMAAALFVAPESRAAFGNVGREVGSEIARGGNMGRMNQGGYIKPAAFAIAPNMFKFVRGGKIGAREGVATGSLVTREAAAARAAREGVDASHVTYTTGQQQEKQQKGRVLFSH